MSLKKNWLEWSVFGLSTALVTATCVGVFYLNEAPGAVPIPPLLTLSTPKPTGELTLVQVTAKNEDFQTLQGVIIEVEMGSERSQFEIDYLPARSKEEGWVAFRQAPAGGARPSARVLSFRTR